MEQTQSLHFFLAADREARAEYFRLRAREYQRTFGFDGTWLEQEDAHDRSGAIVVCRDDSGQILCGARMNICKPADALRLPMEKNGFRLATLLPEMQLARRSYGEVSRLAVAEGHQNGHLLLRLLDALHDYARVQATPLVFSICPYPQARMYRMLYRTGRMQKNFYIFAHVPVPSQFEIEMRLCLFAEAGEV